MKTFKQFLNEAQGKVLELDNFLLDNCTPYMRALDVMDPEVIIYDMPLYRGVNIKAEDERVKLIIDGEAKTCFIKKVRKDRTTVDTHPEISKLLDEVFQEKFGWKARSQGVFCATRPTGLSEFGVVYKIYPIERFSFLYSPKVQDLTTSVHDLFTASGFPKKWYGQKHSEDELEKAKELLSDFVDRKEYNDTDLHGAFTQTRAPEIMLNCDEYLVVPLK